MLVRSKGKEGVGGREKEGCTGLRQQQGQGMGRGWTFTRSCFPGDMAEDACAVQFGVWAQRPGLQTYFRE